MSSRICIHCKVEYKPRVKNQKLCGSKECLSKERTIRAAESRAKIIAKGLCRECWGKNGPVVHGRKKCQACLDREAKRRRKKADANPAFHIYHNTKRRAKEEGLPFDLTMEDIEVPEFCPVLGIKLERGNGTIHDASPTLDKIIPSKGYVCGNVIVMSRRANRLKKNASLGELIALGRWAADVSGMRT